MNDLSLHVLDLAENSLAAGADDIVITMGSDQERFFVIIRDNGHGLTAEACKSALSPFYTTRTTRNVGLGLALMDQLASLCEGRLLVKPLSPGAVVIWTARANHWDLPPQGNIIDTLLALICTNPGIRFRYNYVSAGTVIQIDTNNWTDFRMSVVRRKLELAFEWLGGKQYETG